VDRRGFFQHALRKTGETVVNQVDRQARRQAVHWIRPPYALDELEFLLACTRCGACVDACEYKVVFPLPARLGARVAGTPALDLLNKGCHQCADWPCVTACEAGALGIPETDGAEGLPAPHMAVASIDVDTCLPWNGPECGACASSCTVSGAMVWEGERPRIEPSLCTGCARCREACIVEPKAIRVKSLNHDGATMEVPTQSSQEV